MNGIIEKVLAIVMSILNMLMPFICGTETVKEEPRLVAGVVSDTHIDYRFPIGQEMLTAACEEMNNFMPDVFVDLGDLTNYGDQRSMEEYFMIVTKELNEAIEEVYLTGNHDLGHSEMSNDLARRFFVDTFNRYMDYQIEHNWYSHDVNGYTFIAMGDEDPDNWDLPWYSDEQLAFLDAELARATAGGKPVFVCAHVPLAGIHGEENYYDGVTEEPLSSNVKAILEKYKNVFFMTGHVHKGLSNDEDVPTYKTVNGVHYLTLPSYLMPNWPQGGLTTHGMAFIIECYDDEVVLRARNCVSQTWFKSFEYTVTLA